MKPSEVAKYLRQVASYIEKTPNPSIHLVHSRLAGIVSAFKHASSGSVELTLVDGTKVQHDPSLPAPDGYDPGADDRYHTTVAKVALIRALSGLADGGSAPVELSGLEGYGSLVENSDDLALVSKKGGKIVLEMGPNEQEMELIGEFSSVDEAATKFATELSYFNDF